MTESLNSQPNTTSRTSNGFKTSVERILIALFSLNTMCLCFMLMGSDFFRLNTVPLVSLFVSLGLTIFLVFRGKERLSSQLVKVSLGLILILLLMMDSTFVLGAINFILHDFLFRDSALYYILIIFIIGMLVSSWYFSFQNFQSGSIFRIHAVVAVLFIVFFVFQYANVRKNQALVLQAYEERFLSQPTEELSIYSVEYNFWSNTAYIFVPASEYDPMPTFWDRSIQGYYYQFEYVNGQWQYTGLTGPSFFIID